jgi:hypothetical protein
MPASRVILVSAREKMPFQVTPLMPYLSRLDGKGEPAPATASATGRVTISEQAPRDGRKLVDREVK